MRSRPRGARAARWTGKAIGTVIVLAALGMGTATSAQGAEVMYSGDAGKAGFRGFDVRPGGFLQEFGLFRTESAFAPVVALDNRFLYSIGSGRIDVSAILPTGKLLRIEDATVQRSIGGGVGLEHADLDLSPDGRSLYALDPGFGTPGYIEQYDVDPATGRLSPKTPLRLETADGVTELAISPDGRSAYVAGASGGGRVLQYDIDPSNGALSPKDPVAVPTPARTTGLAVSPDGGNVYVTMQGIDLDVPGYVLSFKVAAGGRLERMEPFQLDSLGNMPRAVGISHDGRNVWVANQGDEVGGASIAQFDRSADGRLVRSADEVLEHGPGTYPGQLLVSPDDRTVYVDLRQGIGMYARGAGGLLVPKDPFLAPDQGASGIALARIPDLAPQPALAATPAEVRPGQTVTFDTTGSTDPNSARDLASWSLDPGDGSLASTGTGAPPATIERTYTTPGIFTPRLTLTDRTGLSATATARVEVLANTPPVAHDDSYGVVGGGTLTASVPGVLGNDSDAEGDPLTAELLTQPLKGTLQLATNGSLRYTPAEDATGTDSFTYRASDGRDTSPAATVTITITPGCNGRAATIVGTAGPDRLTGTSQADVIAGLGGDDDIRGGDGDDLICGGGGADTLHGGDGADVLLGGSGDDAINGGDGDDRIDAGAGFDTVQGGAGTDACTAVEAARGCD